MKVKSWMERMSNKTVSSEYVYDPTFAVLEIESYADNGRVLKRSVVKVRDNRDVMDQYNPADFRIENLAAVGALQDAKRYTISPSKMDMYDAVGDAFDFLSDIADAYSENNVEKE